MKKPGVPLLLACSALVVAFARLVPAQARTDDFARFVDDYFDAQFRAQPQAARGASVSGIGERGALQRPGCFARQLP